MDNVTGYHMSKTIAEYCRRIRLTRIDWPFQSLDLNLIENLWWIIKVQIIAKRHRI